MRLPGLFKDLNYIGQAKGDRKVYHVFENPKGFLVVAGNATNAYNVNWVDRRAVDLVQKKFRGRKVTTSDVRRASGRKKRSLTGGFGALNTLYAMTASRRAKKLREHRGRAMVFQILRG